MWITSMKFQKTIFLYFTTLSFDMASYHSIGQY